MARKIKADKVMNDINVTPMADVMLVLLIIFMITAPLMQQGITVNLPKADNPLDAPEADAQDAVVVAINRDGRVFLKKNPISDTDLYEFLAQRYSGGEINKTMFLRADVAVQYGRVVQIVNQCRNAGVERIGLMADENNPVR